MSILIVDDNRSICVTLQDILITKGFDVEIAFSGAQALEKFNVQEFDCVLMDIIMPQMNGVELFRKLKLIREDIPVVFMTAYSTDNLVRDGLDEGALEVMDKPLDIENLIHCLSAIVIRNF